MRRRLTSLLLCALPLGACSNDGASTAAPSSTAVASTAASTTSTTEAPATSTTVAATTSTVAATTTTEPLPVPAPAPEPRAPEAFNQLGSIEIPALGISKPLLEGVTLTTLDHGPGHWPGTAMPGHLGNVVIGGHRTSHDHPFRHIDQLAAGDEVILTTAEGRFVYQVTLVEVVTPDAIWIIDQTPNYTATLFACHPAGSTRQRIVVHLQLLQP